MKLFLAAFAANEENLWRGIDLFKEKFGDPDVVSPSFPINETGYYAKEMGQHLIKNYLSWPQLIDPAELVAIKLAAMEWERELAGPLGRMVNLDPGYIFEGGLVLSTAKYNGHRLHLGGGIWGELTLHFHKGIFNSFVWTYPDYQNPEIQNYLLQMRKNYIEDRKKSQV